ncbi:MAG TPA: styrene monooxygenase/indole monooxygenase family protein [Thermomonospora sp.]|nr:styrene monooxygenase/indole monooxygenase family protein [Thermomonospora sp.]
MRKILIVGAGQSGLQLALSLQAEGYEVTLMSARTPEEIRAGRIMSTQVQFAPALKLERERGLNLWQEQAPWIVGQRSTLADPPGEQAFTFIGRWDEYAQSVDQRVKMAGWLELFESRGGNAIYHTVMTSDLEGLAALYDLTIIAAGKGELVELFDRDASRSPYDRPQRMLSCVYLHGMKPRPDYPEPHVRLTLVPGVGELIYMPAYTLSGPCDIVLWEAVPGGPFDIWDDRPDPAAHLRRSLELMREYMPWEYELFTEAEPTDGRCTLYGGYAPVVRHPVGEPSPGTLVLGMADVVVANDPVTGQGANNATHCAAIYQRAITEHGDRPFDRAWMQATFDAYWEYAQHPTRITNLMLAPPPEHVVRVLATAARNPAVAHRFAYGSADPADLASWILDPAAADAYLASVADRATAP